MQTVAASVILDDVYQLMGWDQTQLEPRQEQMARSALSTAVQEVWNAWWWAELMKCETIPGAPIYNPNETLASGQVRYFPATKKYYQALQNMTGVDPEILDANQTYQLNVGYWYPAQRSYSGLNWNPTMTNNVGEVVRNPADGLFYALYAPNNYLSVAGAGFDGVNGKYTDAGPFNGKDAYAGNGFISWDSTQWVFASFGVTRYTSTEDVASPDLVTNWVSADPDFDPTPTLAFINAPPSDPTYWTVLNEFVPTLVLNGDLRQVSGLDPRAYNDPEALDTELVAEGIRVHGCPIGEPWAWYRRPTPVITGDAYDVTIGYAATPPQDLVFDT